MAKVIKPHRLFLKPIPEKTYTRRIIKKIYMDSDRKLLDETLVRDEKGNYCLPAGLPDETLIRLNDAADRIVRNAGFGIQVPTTVLALVVLAAVIAFGALFKNVLIRKAMEAGLEAVFNARADIRGLDFSVLGARIKLDSLTVADESAPMMNLFELGKTEIRLEFNELLKAKFVARNIECQEIRWNTPRKESGALRKQSAAVPGGQAGSTNSQSSDSKPLIPDFSNIDINAIIIANSSNLKSALLISNSRVKTEEMTNRWSVSISNTRTNIGKLTVQADSIRKINASSLKTIPDVQKAIKLITDTFPAVDSLARETSNSFKNLGGDLKTAGNLINEARTSIEKDYQYLLSFVKLPAGGVKGLLGTLLNRILAEKLGKFYFYALKARRYAGAFGGKEPGAKKAPERAPVRRGGTDVAFAYADYPTVLIENLAASAGLTNSGTYLSAWVRDISSDPAGWKRPLTFFMDNLENGRNIKISGFSDQRPAAADSFGLDFLSSNFPLELTNGLEFMNATSLTAGYELNVSFRMPSKGGSSGRATVMLTNIRLTLMDNESLINRIILDAIKAVPRVILQISFSIGDDGSFNLVIESNLDEEISRKAGSFLADTWNRYQKEIKDAVWKLAEPELKKNEQVYNALKELEKLSGGNLTSLSGIRSELDKKKKELEEQLKRIAGSTIQNLPGGLPRLPGR